jgi:hypothetical protein
MVSTFVNKLMAYIQRLWENNKWGDAEQWASVKEVVQQDVVGVSDEYPSYQQHREAQRPKLLAEITGEIFGDLADGEEAFEFITGTVPWNK